MSNPYYQTISELESKKVNRDYITGWASGYLGNPVLEEQRVTDSWQAGYDDGKEKVTDNADKWLETGASP